MNVADERLQIPPPPGCLACAKRETTIIIGIARHRCREGHPMHDHCGFRVLATVGQQQRGGAVAAHPPT